MAVAHSAASESHTGTTGSTNQTAFSWTHTQTGNSFTLLRHSRETAVSGIVSEFSISVAF